MSGLPDGRVESVVFAHEAEEGLGGAVDGDSAGLQSLGGEHEVVESVTEAAALSRFVDVEVEDADGRALSALLHVFIVQIQRPRPHFQQTHQQTALSVSTGVFMDGKIWDTCDAVLLALSRLPEEVDPQILIGAESFVVGGELSSELLSLAAAPSHLVDRLRDERKLPRVQLSQRCLIQPDEVG